MPRLQGFTLVVPSHQVGGRREPFEVVPQSASHQTTSLAARSTLTLAWPGRQAHAARACGSNKRTARTGRRCEHGAIHELAFGMWLRRAADGGFFDGARTVQCG